MTTKETSGISAEGLRKIAAAADKRTRRAARLMAPPQIDGLDLVASSPLRLMNHLQLRIRVPMTGYEPASVWDKRSVEEATLACLGWKLGFCTSSEVENSLHAIRENHELFGTPGYLTGDFTDEQGRVTTRLDLVRGAVLTATERELYRHQLAFKDGNHNGATPVSWRSVYRQR